MKQGKNLLASHDVIIADGAMGTWYVHKYQRPLAECEQDNIHAPDYIREIHREYIFSGADLVRTNTFALVNEETCGDTAKIEEMARAGFRIAAEAASQAGREIWIGADFGPVYDIEPEQYIPAWEAAVRGFVSEGADFFVLETLASLQEMLPLIKIIRSYKQNAVILVSFAISADGFTRKGLSLSQLDRQVEEIDDIDIFGLNCGIGPTHLRSLINKLNKSGKPISLMPNSGYPRLEKQRMIFGSTPEYFSASILDLKHPRILILGGCCGTTPSHINELALRLEKTSEHIMSTNISSTEKESPEQTLSPHEILQKGQLKADALSPDHISKKLAKGEFVYICELDPPGDSNMNNLLDAANDLKNTAIDTITISDSPLARVKLDSIIAAARIYRETGIPVLPHLTCRDRNVNALRSTIMGAHSEGIRQLLIVTGDRLPESNRGFVKPVFNVNSTGLLELSSQMNLDLFVDDPVLLFAACDLGVQNPDLEYERILNKQKSGAAVFLSQPVYDWDDRKSRLATAIRQAGPKLLIGLMPLVSYRNASYMDQEVPGIRIPTEIISEFTPDMSKIEAENTGLRQITALADTIRPYADGFYLITPFNRSHIIKRFLQEQI